MRFSHGNRPDLLHAARTGAAPIRGGCRRPTSRCWGREPTRGQDALSLRVTFDRDDRLMGLRWGPNLGVAEYQPARTGVGEAGVGGCWAPIDGVAQVRLRRRIIRASVAPTARPTADRESLGWSDGPVGSSEELCESLPDSWVLGSPDLGMSADRTSVAKLKALPVPRASMAPDHGDVCGSGVDVQGQQRQVGVRLPLIGAGGPVHRGQGGDPRQPTRAVGS